MYVIVLPVSCAPGTSVCDVMETTDVLIPVPGLLPPPKAFLELPIGTVKKQNSIISDFPNEELLR